MHSSQKRWNIDPAILWVADLLNIKNVFKVGGSQAIFAMAYGTKSIPKVFKNIWARKSVCN